MKKRLQQWLTLLMLSGVAVSIAAHTYFVGLSELSLNSLTDKIEIIHQLTAHDMENAIAEIKHIQFSPEHQSYEKYIQAYVEEHFQLQHSGQVITLNLVGIELVRGKVIIYQEALFKNILNGLVVKNSLLVNTYSKQVNTVNYKSAGLKGSLTFTEAKKVTTITNNK
ncbi:MAG: hypothetical protein ACI9LM_002746 [Alteromonadaceae bacterium]|jgi:hypothetical protein